MSKYVRKTRDVYEVQGNYGYGWDVVTTENTREKALIMLACYRENEPRASHRIVKKREKIA